ncbi:MAG: PIG-L family deacetylase [Clostridia bacterium]|nr:PIG-L family deacetylase [Clostridia bacterium]
MKKSLLISLLLLLLCCAAALSEEAQDITDQCKFAASPGKFKLTRMYDRDYRTAYMSNKQKTPYVELTAPKDSPVYSLYVCFAHKTLIPWELQAKRGRKWETVYESAGTYAHEYVVLTDGEEALRVKSKAEKQSQLIVNEIFAFGPGDKPAFVQIWEPTPEKADLLVIAAHPDDEILFFGGTIPTYAVERGLNVVVAYMTNGTTKDGITSRRSELLNGLWEMGVRQYPVVGTFDDLYSAKLDKGYSIWNKTKTWQYITALYRQYKPEAVITHDVNGEYGHGAHRVCADAAQRCIAMAADANTYPDTAAQWGVWQVKKLYLHLYKENAVEMDWDQPLSAVNGRTGFEAALDAYQWHVSQHDASQKNPKTGKYEPFTVEPRDSDYSCYRFGLAYTAVGPDMEKNDFLENIPGY